jgi:hypothetical protein
MTAPDQLHVVTVPQLDPRLGRQVVHDPASRRFAFRAEAPPKRDITLRVYGPRTRPNQEIGNCTGVAECVMGDTIGNRIAGVTLNMDDAVRIYSRATELDPWDGQYPPTDTGSSGTAAANAAVEMGIATRFEWIFNGADGILAALAAGHSVSVGTWWLHDMWNVDQATGLINVGGDRDGGHQWCVVGYSKRYDAFRGECWWGTWGFRNTGRFLIRRQDLAELLSDDGDAHVSYRKIT